MAFYKCIQYTRRAEGFEMCVRSPPHAPTSKRDFWPDTPPAASYYILELLFMKAESRETNLEVEVRARRKLMSPARHHPIHTM